MDKDVTFRLIQISFYVLLCFAIPAHSADPRVLAEIALAKKHGFKIVYEEGMPIDITWPDGRRASSFKRTKSPLRLSLPMQITENLCVAKSRKTSCTYNLDVKFEALDMRWTKHPDSSRLGKIIGGQSEYEAGSRQAIWTTPLKSIAPRSTVDLKEDELVCESWDWLPNSEKNKPPAQVKMSSIDGDANFENYFTEVAVNQGLSGFYDSVWNRTEQGSLKLIKTGTAFTQSEFFIPPFLGFMMSFTVENPLAKTPQEKFCQVTVRPDSSKITSAWGSVLKDVEPVPYALGSDELFYYLQLYYDGAVTLFHLGDEHIKNGKRTFKIVDIK